MGTERNVDSNSFPGTISADIRFAAQGQANQSERFLLAARYAPSLAAFLQINHGWDYHNAYDCTQDFLNAKILQPGFLDRWDSKRGRFRWFLAGSLRRFAMDWRQSAKGGRPVGQVPLDQAPPIAVDLQDEMDRGIDSRWVEQVLAEAWKVMRDRFPRSAEILDAWMRDASYTEIAAAVGITSEGQVTGAIRTAKKQFRRALLDCLAAYGVDGEEAMELLQDVRACGD